VTENSETDECAACSESAIGPHPIFDLCEAQHFDEALQICRSELARNPNDAAGYRHTAIVLELMNNMIEALSYRNKVVELAPECTMSYFARADLLYRMGNYAAAIADFTRSAELDREQTLGPTNYLYRADCHRRLGDYERAIADCAQVPDDFDFPGFLGQWEGSKHHLLAEILHERGRR